MPHDDYKKPAFDPMTVETHVGTNYPAPFDEISKTRIKRKLGDAAGLRNFGVNLVHLEPGQGSSQRHWHTKQDEFIYILEGQATLITNAGEQTLLPGACAGFPAGIMDGHQLINKSDTVVVYLEVGDRTSGDSGEYPDIDLRAEADPDKGYRFTRKDGTAYG